MENSNKTIIKNTIALYARMLITMAVALLSSRVLLRTLGFVDYGLYNVIAGVVSLFAFLMSSMTSATQRFLSYEQGKNDKTNLPRIFSMSLTTHALIALVLLILAETIGLWFLNTQINIPDGREFAANVVFQSVVLSLCVNVIIVPYSALVISHEEMTYYAYISIFDSFAKLGIAYFLLVCSNDKLCVYGILLFVVTILDFIFYYIICRKKYKESKYQLFFDKELFKRLFGFTGWTMLGQFAIVGANQGSSILVNIFHTVVYNASLGIANQVNGALNGLVSNFQTAFQPQITKSFSGGDYQYMSSLMINAAKISFFLLFIVALPVLINIDWILNIWLGEVPPLSNVFCIFFMIASLINSIGGPVWMAVFATGRIKHYQVSVFFLYTAYILMVLIAFKLGASPAMVVYVNAAICFILLFVRLYFAKKELPFFSILNFIAKVILPISAIISITILAYYLIGIIVNNPILETIFVFSISVTSILLIGLSHAERENVYKLIKNKISK